jgi:hypothetical protein
MRAQLASFAVAGILLAACSEQQVEPSKCLLVGREFCVGAAARSYDVTIDEKVRSIDGSIYVVRGIRTIRPASRFVAIVRQLDAPDLGLKTDRMKLCKRLGIDATDCENKPLKVVRHHYDVLLDYGAVIHHGVRIDLIFGTDDSKDIAEALAFPCAGTGGSEKICGPNLGTCIVERHSDICDFRRNLWTDFLKWRSRNS